MTARKATTAVSLGLALGLGACTSFYEIAIETPIQPKLDVSAFRRVLVAGFITGGSEDVDANLETVRLLRSQLRTKSDLTVIDLLATGFLPAPGQGALAVQCRADDTGTRTLLRVLHDPMTAACVEAERTLLMLTLLPPLAGFTKRG